MALPDSGRLLRKEGLLVADNVAFEDSDEFNRMISSHDVFAPHLFAKSDGAFRQL